MSYKQIHETFWTAPDVKKYKPMQRYLFGYFITSPHAHYSGLYYLPLIYIQNETGLTIKEIKQGIVFLSNTGHIFYDFDREVVFVKSEILYQLDNKRDGKVILNEKHISGLKKHFDTLHKSPLIGKFLETYDYLQINYTGIDRGIDTPMDTDSVTVTVTVPVTVKDLPPPPKVTPQRKIIPPDLEWVKSYCKDRGNQIDAQYFFDYHEQRDWHIGKDATIKMSDWQATIRTWESRNKNTTIQLQTPAPVHRTTRQDEEEWEAQLKKGVL